MAEKYQPLVSIIIPVYKGELYLKESIESALNQTYPNIEVIVVNDGSPDGGATEKIALSYGDKIRYFYKENGGVATALNFGVQQMRGEWFSWLSHDDVYLPEKIEKQIDAVAELEDKVCVVRCSTMTMDGEGKPIARPTRKAEGRFSAQQMLEQHLLKKLGLYGCTLLIHKSVLEVCGKFDLELRTAQDEDYWTRIMFSGYHFVSVADALVKIRIHAGQTTHVLAERFEPEWMICAEKTLEYYKGNRSANEENMIVYICNHALGRKTKILKMLLAEMGKIRNLTLAEKMKIGYYRCIGFGYAFVKNAYRTMVIKRHRK